MPTIKPRVTITMDSEQLNKIEEYRFKNRCKNQTQAILSLIEAGFSVLEISASNTPNKDAFSTDEMKIIKKYRKLDAHGKEMVDFVLKKESERCENAAPLHLMPIAAHNDHANNPEELERMKKDLDKL